MLLGTQWYILFNVIAGAMAIPADLREAAGSYRFSGWQRFWKLYLPAVFPYLVTGWVTAAGGAWNASIVSEYDFDGSATGARTAWVGAMIMRSGRRLEAPGRLAGRARRRRAAGLGWRRDGLGAGQLRRAGGERADDVGDGRHVQPPRLATALSPRGQRAAP